MFYLESCHLDVALNVEIVFLGGNVVEGHITFREAYKA